MILEGVKRTQQLCARAFSVIVEVSNQVQQSHGPRPKVLVLKPSSFGDIIHTLPAVAWMKEVHPEWRFSWLVNSEWMPLLAGNPDLDEIISFPRREFRGVFGLLKFGRWCGHGLSKDLPDVAVDFQGLLRTAVLAKASGARTIYGLADAREGARWFYDHRTANPELTPHAVEKYLRLAGSVLGMSPETVTELRFPLSSGVAPACAAELDGKKFILLHPFSRGAGKSLTVEQVTELGGHFPPGTQLVVVGGRSDGEKLILPRNWKNLLNATNLNELIWLIKRAAFMISVDSGPVHLAAALGCPLLAIHTWSDPRKVGPYHPEAWLWKSGQIFRFSQRHAFGEDFYRRTPPPLQSSVLAEIAALASGNGVQNRRENQ